MDPECLLACSQELATGALVTERKERAPLGRCRLADNIKKEQVCCEDVN